jgi:O-antigen/teichoic acid export membrane protein
MTGRGPSLQENFFLSLSGNVVFAACLWGILITLTKLGTTVDVGRFALASAIANPVLILANLQLRSVFVADSCRSYAFRDFLGVRLLSLPIAVCVLAVIAGLAYSGTQLVVIMAFGLARAVDGVGDIFYGLAQKRERLSIIAGSMIARGLLSLTLFAGLFWLTRSLAWSMFALPAGWALPILAFDIPRCRALLPDSHSLRPRWHSPSMRRIVWTALPLGLVVLFIQLRPTVPRTMLEHARGEGDLGIFAALAYLVIVGDTIVLALSQASIARLARQAERADTAAFGRTVRKLVAMGVVLGLSGFVLAFFLGDRVLATLYGRQYAEHHHVFMIVMAAGGMMYIGSLMGAPTTAMRAFRTQLWIHAANASILFMAGLLLIPRFGMEGAAWTMLAGAIWVTTAYAFVVIRGIKRMGTPRPAHGDAS